MAFGEKRTANGAGSLRSHLLRGVPDVMGEPWTVGDHGRVLIWVPWSSNREDPAGCAVPSCDLPRRACRHLQHGGWVSPIASCLATTGAVAALFLPAYGPRRMSGIPWYSH
jgi:hypothetical protein